MFDQKALSLLAFGAVSSVHAQSLNLAVKFSSDGGATWSSQVEAVRGSVVQGAIFMSGEGQVYGLGGATLRLTATGAHQNDSAQFGAGTQTGRVGPFNFGAATNAIYTTADGFRIDAASDPENTNPQAGLTFFQRDPSSGGAGFSTANPALVFRFDVLISSANAERGIQISLDELSNGVASYYSSSSATRSTRLAATLSGGTIYAGIFPAPGTLLAVCLGGVLTRRRTRRV